MRFTKNLTFIFLRTLFKETITQICEGLFHLMFLFRINWQQKLTALTIVCHRGVQCISICNN